MKYSEINKRYTEIVTEYMNKGYTINTATMNGSQGEIAKIDLTNGNEIIRVRVSTFHTCEGYGKDGIEITVGKSTDNVKPNGNYEALGNTIWDNHLEIISMERYYKIDRYNNDFYGTEKEADKANEVRYQRYKNRKDATEPYKASEKAIEVAQKVICRKMGYKRINPANVHIRKEKGGYCVVYNGKYCFLR